MHRRPPSLFVFAVLLVAQLLSACGGGDGEVRWRDLALTPPPGWVVFEDGATALSLSDAPLGEEGAPGPGEAAAFITWEPGASADAWRQLAVEVLDAEVEVDETIDVGGAPATRLLLRHASGDVPTREMIVIVPARSLVLLMQPVVLQGDDDGPDVFDRHRAEFDALIDSIRFTAPVS